jgi:hypothetical protein
MKKELIYEDGDNLQIFLIEDVVLVSITKSYSSSGANWEVKFCNIKDKS